MPSPETKSEPKQETKVEPKAKEPKADTTALIAKHKADLQSRIESGRKLLTEFEAKVKLLNEQIGNAGGAIITANDVQRHDAARALAGLERAVAAFREIK